jgi:predicted transcriptional regulator
MREKTPQSERKKAHNNQPVRASITFPSDLHEALEKIALQKKVSLAWVVRDASERYVAEETTEAGLPRPGKR